MFLIKFSDFVFYLKWHRQIHPCKIVHFELLISQNLFQDRFLHSFFINCQLLKDSNLQDKQWAIRNRFKQILTEKFMWNYKTKCKPEILTKSLPQNWCRKCCRNNHLNLTTHFPANNFCRFLHCRSDLLDCRRTLGCWRILDCRWVELLQFPF